MQANGYVSGLATWKTIYSLQYSHYIYYILFLCVYMVVANWITIM